MLCDVEVQDAPTIMGDDEKAVEHPERDRWNGGLGSGRAVRPFLAFWTGCRSTLPKLALSLGFESEFEPEGQTG
jgi:hypothetical protein